MQRLGLSRTSLSILTLVIVAALAPAQVVYVHDGFTPGLHVESYLPSAAYPVGGPAPPPAVGLPNAALLPPTATPFGGGLACDELNGTIYTTDGFNITIDQNPAYVGITPPPPGLPPFPLPTSIPQPLVAMAFDSAGQILYVTDGALMFGLTPFPPFNVLTNTPLGAFVVGLGFEQTTGNFWGCDPGGGCFNFDIIGNLVQPPIFIAIPGPLLTGLTVSTSALPSPPAFPPPFCSTQLPQPAYHVTVTDGFNLFDVLTGNVMPVAGPGFQGGTSLGYSSDRQILPGATGCLTTGVFPLAGLRRPLTTGTNNALAVAGLIAFEAPLGLLDLCPLPGGAFLAATGETLWVNPFSPTTTTFGAIADAAGLAVVPFFIPPGVGNAGIQFTFQWFVPDLLHPLNFCLSDGCTVSTGFLF